MGINMDKASISGTVEMPILGSSGTIKGKGLGAMYGLMEVCTKDNGEETE